MSDEEVQFLEDNIATVAFHLGQPGARLNISHDKSGLAVDPGEVLQEISRRLTRDRAQVAQVQEALELAVNIIMASEPGDSRAVSNEAVALAAVSCGDTSDPVMKVIRDALALSSTDVAQGEPDPDAMNDKRLHEDMTLAHNARKAAIEECAQLIESGADLIDQDELDQQAKYIRALSTPSAGKQADDDGHAFRKNPHSEADFCALCRRPENLHRNRSTHPSTTRGTASPALTGTPTAPTATVGTKAVAALALPPADRGAAT